MSPELGCYLRALSIAGAETKREVVTIPTGNCQSVRFVLTPELGTAIAATHRPFAPTRKAGSPHQQ
jgi:hypothetical protein